MSLINEALKKAEQARAGGLPEAPAAPSAPVIAKRGRAIGTRTLVLLGVVVVLVAVGGTTMLFLRSGPEPASAPRAPGAVKATVAPAAKPAAARTSEAPSPTPTPSSPGSAASPAATPAPSSSMPVPTVNAPPATSSVTPAANVPPAAPAAAVSAPPPPPAAPVSAAPAIAPSTTVAVSAPSPAPPVTPASPAVTAPLANATPRPDEKIAEYLDRLRILGVRSPGPDARVLIGERVYRINDVVDRSLGIRLQKVDPGKITFIDAAGVTYTKNY